MSNVVADLPRADAKADRRRQRRALTENELGKLLEVARLRPVAEFGRAKVKLPPDECKGRRTWRLAPLTLDTLDAAAEGEVPKEAMADFDAFQSTASQLGGALLLLGFVVVFITAFYA